MKVLLLISLIDSFLIPMASINNSKTICFLLFSESPSVTQLVGPGLVSPWWGFSHKCVSSAYLGWGCVKTKPQLVHFHNSIGCLFFSAGDWSQGPAHTQNIPCYWAASHPHPSPVSLVNQPLVDGVDSTHSLTQWSLAKLIWWAQTISTKGATKTWTVS
jgi:hypothetical protein